MKNSMKILALLVLGGLVTLEACKKKDSEPTPLSLTAMTAGGTDLNGANAPTGVDPGATIISTFTTAIDPATATTANVTLTRDFDQENVAIGITTSGNTLTIAPTTTLSGGATYVVSLGAGLKSTAGLSFTTITRSFTTSGTFTPDGQVSYWSFESNANDVVGSNDPGGANDVVDITYVDGRNAAAGKAASFNGTTSIIEIPSGDQIMAAEFTIAFWMNLDSSALKSDGISEKDHTIMGMGNFHGMQFEVEDHEKGMKWAQSYKIVNNSVADTADRDIHYGGNGVIKGTGADSATVVSKTQTGAEIQGMIGHQWNHVVYTFSATTKVTSLFWNGVLIYQLDYNFFQNNSDLNARRFYGVTSMAFEDPGVAPGADDYYDKTWAFGFWESRASTFPSWGQADLQYNSIDAAHFKGELDDIHLFHRALTQAEITLMYNSEK